MKTLMIIFYTIMIEVAIAELIFVIWTNIHFIKQKKLSKKRDEEIHKAIMKKLEEKNNG
jgi:hypothetical protein